MDTTVGSSAIHYLCTHPGHDGRHNSGADKLTIFDSRWAYCRADARLGDHEWSPTGGMALEMLASRSGGRPLAPPGTRPPSVTTRERPQETRIRR
ncbi:MAG: hypothetical protein ABR525_10410 [Candidatus Limnocylindria bacterium]